PDLEVHAAHATHAAAHATAAMAVAVVLLRQLGDDRFGGDRQTGDRRSVLQRGAGHLGRIQDAHRHHVTELAGGGVVAEVALAFLDLVEDHGRLFAGVGDDRAQRRFQRAAGDRDAQVLVGVVALQAFDRLQRADQRDTAAGDHALFDGCAGGVQGVFDTGLLFLHLDLGAGTDLDDRNAAGQLDHALLQLLLVVVGRGLLDLRLDLRDARLDLLRFTGTIDDRGVFLGDDDALGATQIGDRGLLQRQADFLGHDLAVGQDRDVFEDRLATVAKARRLDGGDLDDAADGVDHQRGQRLALDFFGHDQQRLARLGDGFQHRQQLADVGDLLVVDQDVRVIQLDLLALLVVDEIWRQVAAVELHALDHVQLVLQTRTFLDRDHAFLADFLHRGGDDVADVGVGVGRDRADLRDFLVVRGRVGHLLQLTDGGRNRLVDATLQVHRIDTGGHGLEAFLDKRLRQHGGGGGAVTGDVGGLRRGFLDDLRAEVLVLVGQLDLLRDGHAVLGDRRGAEALLEHDVAALRAQGDLDRIGQGVDALQHAGAGVFAETYFFSSHTILPRNCE